MPGPHKFCLKISTMRQGKKPIKLCDTTYMHCRLICREKKFEGGWCRPPAPGQIGLRIQLKYRRKKLALLIHVVIQSIGFIQIKEQINCLKIWPKVIAFHVLILEEHKEEILILDSSNPCQNPCLFQSMAPSEFSHTHTQNLLTSSDQYHSESLL